MTIALSRVRYVARDWIIKTAFGLREHLRKAIYDLVVISLVYKCFKLTVRNRFRIIASIAAYVHYWENSSDIGLSILFSMG